MAIAGVAQPLFIQIHDDLRLRRFDGTADFAFAWYQDEELVYLVDGVRKAYDRNTLEGMYRYLDSHGELYFIEAREDGTWRPIGDVTFSRTDMPIVIGEHKVRICEVEGIYPLRIVGPCQNVLEGLPVIPGDLHAVQRHIRSNRECEGVGVCTPRLGRDGH